MQEAEEVWFLQWWKVFYTGWSGKIDLYKRHHYALRTLYENIETPYVFHCEDDQIFKKTNFDYIQLSREILEYHAEIGIVQLRDLAWDFGIKKTGLMRSRYYELLTDVECDIFGHHFIYAHEDNIFSLQPWLRRTEEMRKVMFWHEDYVDEKLINTRMIELWLQSVVLIPWIFNHINPVFHSTKNIKNLGLFRYFISFLSGVIRYRGRLLILYIKGSLKK
jgi:hypothetical protein